MRAADLRLNGDWHRVGAGLAVRFAMAEGRIDAEWRPRQPTRREFRRVLDRYRDARNVFLCELAQRTGEAVMCMEAPE
ncbi:MAG: hypothetical protein IPI03_07385 [Rubrivivax sp.]|nr:hypothetical protein [Rubrivivax sp.]MBK8527147.1 hypothetical protein [Rubrivivax sp.]